MNGIRFDDVARALVTSRRGVLKTILGGAVVGTAALLNDDVVVALPKPPGFERLGKRCGRGRHCGVYVPCTNGFCRPVKCLIQGELVEDRAKNPNNPCERCLALENNNAWRRWSDVRDGQTCPPDDSGNPCLSTFIATCQDGVCVPDQLPDGTDCGDDQTCCSGVCSPAGECCPTGRRRANGECPTGCTIDGVDYLLADLNQDNWCQWCEPATSTTSWSPVPPNRACDFTGLTVCCDGGCCPQGTICQPSQGGVACSA